MTLARCASAVYLGSPVADFFPSVRGLSLAFDREGMQAERCHNGDQVDNGPHLFYNVLFTMSCFPPPLLLPGHASLPFFLSCTRVPSLVRAGVDVYSSASLSLRESLFTVCARGGAWRG